MLCAFSMLKSSTIVILYELAVPDAIVAAGWMSGQPPEAVLI